MRLSRLTLALLALPATTLAAALSTVSLSDFTPRVSDLPVDCETVYTGSIEGCTPDDFLKGGCSESCVDALAALTPKVERACGNKGIEGTNIIVAFLHGAGPQDLCKDASKYLSSAAPTSAAGYSTTTSSSSSADTTWTTTTSTESASKHGTSSTLTTTETSIATAVSSMQSTASSTTSSEGHSQTDLNDHSGGGSPFDTQGNLISAAAVTSFSFAIALITSALGLAAFWQ